MAAPTRFTSGFTQAARWQPLGDLGIPDPFFYAYYEDDFLPYNATLYTVTSTGGGTVAATAAKGSGGRVLMTTGASAGSFEELQLPVASFQYTVGKKLAYLARLQVDNALNDVFVGGLVNTTATPFPGGGVTDGIYFAKAAATTNIVVTAVTGSVVIGTTTIVGALTTNTDLDIGFMVDRLGNIKIFYGNNLEGFKRQNVATLVPDASIPASALTGAISTAILNPTIAIGNGATAAPITGVVDFMFAAQER